MRLGRMRELLDRSVPILGGSIEIQGSPENIGGNAAQLLNGITGSALRSALNDLSEIPGLRGRALDLRRRAVVIGAPDGGPPIAAVGSHDIPNLQSAIRELHTVADALRLTLAELAPPANEDRLYVRAPDDVNDLGGLEKFADDLRLALEMPVRLLTGEQIVFRGVERGSTWLVIGLLSAAVFQATRALIGVCDKYCAKQLEKEHAQEVLQGLGAFTNEVKQAAQEGLRMYGLAMAKELDGTFAEVHPPDHEGDVPQKLLHSVEVLAGLYFRGVELQLAAAKKNEAVAQESNDVGKQLAEAVVKLLGDGKTGDS